MTAGPKAPAGPKTPAGPRPGTPARPARHGEPASQRLLNSVVRTILRSPLHRATSGRALVVTVVGRKTGKVCRAPAGYVDHDGGLLVGTAGTWRKDLATDATVTVLLRRRWCQASAEVITDEERLTGLYRAVLARDPIHGKYAKTGVEPDGSPDLADLRAAVARGIAVVRLTLQPPGPSSASQPARTTTASGDASNNSGLMMMLAAHDAFRRDLGRSGQTTESAPTDGPVMQRRWRAFRDQLHTHHTGEGTALWPPLRQAASRPEDLSVIDAMEPGHAALEPLLAATDAAFASKGPTAALDAVRRLAPPLTDHLAHEEREALPLVERLLGPEGWTAFQRHLRKLQRVKGGAVFFPWVLDGAPPTTVRDVLGTLPPPARVPYRRAWQPRYSRALHYANQGSGSP